MTTIELVRTRLPAAAAWKTAGCPHPVIPVQAGLRAGCQWNLALAAEVCCAQGQRAGPGAALVQRASWTLGRWGFERPQQADHAGLAAMTQHGELACLLGWALALLQAQKASSPVHHQLVMC